jgi:aryl-alcohol dehydrogenase-like predicted oxidoreductase
MLQTRPFGRTDMEITPVGVGAWAMGGGGWSFGWGDQEDRESMDAIRHALDSGVNWIDTAPAYGMGHSEEVIGRALAGLAEEDRPYVFTKCGLIVPDDPFADPEPVGDPTTLRRECEESLRRLRVERLDLFQVHWPAKDGTPIEEYWGVLLDLKAEGKIRAAGLSNHRVDQLRAAEALGPVDSVQPPFSAIDRGAAADILPWAQQSGAAVIVYSPMQSGLLTGAFSRERFDALHPEDWRRKDEQFTTHLDANLRIADALRDIADRHQTTVAAVAVAWTLAWPGVTGAIVGARRPTQVDGWLPAAQLRLDEADLDEVASVLRTTGAGAGPTKPPVAATAP